MQEPLSRRCPCLVGHRRVLFKDPCALEGQQQSPTATAPQKGSMDKTSRYTLMYLVSAALARPWRTARKIRHCNLSSNTDPALSRTHVPWKANSTPDAQNTRKGAQQHSTEFEAEHLTKCCSVSPERKQKKDNHICFLTFKHRNRPTKELCQNAARETVSQESSQKCTAISVIIMKT